MIIFGHVRQTHIKLDSACSKFWLPSIHNSSTDNRSLLYLVANLDQAQLLAGVQACGSRLRSLGFFEIPRLPMWLLQCRQNILRILPPRVYRVDATNVPQWHIAGQNHKNSKNVLKNCTLLSEVSLKFN